MLAQRPWAARLMMTVPAPVFLADYFGSSTCTADCGAEMWWFGAVIVSWFYLVTGLAIGTGLTRGSDFAVRLGIVWAASATIAAGLAVVASLLGLAPAGDLVRSPLEAGLHVALVAAAAATFVLLMTGYRREAASRSSTRLAGSPRGIGLW